MQLHRSNDDYSIAGVCGGLAENLGWDSGRLRLVWVLATIFTAFAGVVIYLALWYLMDPAEAGATISPGLSGSGPRSGSVSPTAAKARFERLERRLRTIESCVTQEELELRREFKNLET